VDLPVHYQVPVYCSKYRGDEVFHAVRLSVCPAPTIYSKSESCIETSIHINTCVMSSVTIRFKFVKNLL